MENYLRAYEYESNVNPELPQIEIITHNINVCDYGITPIDLRSTYNVNFEATTANLLACFIKMGSGQSCLMEDKLQNSFINASSHLFYIFKGSAHFIVDNEIFFANEDSIFISPSFLSLEISNMGSDDLHIYYVNDSPLINYLGAISLNKTFKPALYSQEFIHKNLEILANPNNNRKGILLGNKDTEFIGTKTITPVLWSLYNELPPHTHQKAHRHNSVALDLCIHCTDSENIYTLVGEELDNDGNIINPIKVNWNSGEMFITPPGLWHSHHNDGDTSAYILPIQDAGLLIFQRILGIEIKK